MKSHYFFDYRFCQVRRANEKGVVEGTVKYARLNFFVPVPHLRDLEDLAIARALHGGSGAAFSGQRRHQAAATS